MAKVAVQLIIGQNNEPFLPYAIDAVQWADYYTVCNTAPDDPIGKENAYTIKSQIHESKLKYTEIIPDENGYFSFADARNACLSMTSYDDFVLIVDSDDVHFPEWEQIVRDATNAGVDSITAHFYHMMVYKDIYQFVQSREIVYKNYRGTEWAKGVHEQLIHKKQWPVTSNYHYMHYGYIKSQREVFNRWKFYSDLEGDYHHYDGQNPDRILDDRISVSKPLQIKHPPVIEEFLKSYPSCPPIFLRENKETVPVEKVGLILLVHNDEEFLDKCLETLTVTHSYPNFELLVIDLASSDKSLQKVMSYDEVLPMEVVQTDQLLSLSEALNYGLDHFRIRHDIQYIGWIHPDMQFDDRNWLTGLWQTMQTFPKIGKVCSANTRDTIPKEVQPGQEQCFIIRKDIVNKVGLFDEKFIGIGGYEDWDYNKRILNHDDYKVMITPYSKVYHHGMGTRSKRDTTREQIANAEYYQEKWGTSEAPV